MKRKTKFSYCLNFHFHMIEIRFYNTHITSVRYLNDRIFTTRLLFLVSDLWMCIRSFPLVSNWLHFRTKRADFRPTEKSSMKKLTESKMLCFRVSSMKKDMAYSHLGTATLVPRPWCSHLGTATLVQLPWYLKFHIWYQFNTHLHHNLK